MIVIAATPAAQIAPVALPMEQCAWCWPLLHPGEPYPASWSSTICATHIAWMDKQRAERRSRRAREAATVV